MQIRLTVLGPRPDPLSGRATACDVLVTAPPGTALATVASGLASAAGGSESPAVLYADQERLDAQRCTLGEPPLTDGAVLSLGGPAEPGPEPAGAAAQLHVVAGPDAGGVHLLHGGQIRIGRSVEADVPLDDPDVSRLHCAVTLAEDGGVQVSDLGSTNGTTVDGRPVAARPVRLPTGALLRLGESAVKLTSGPETGPALPTAPDGEGHVRVRGSGRRPPVVGTTGSPGPAGSPGPHGATPPAQPPAPGDTGSGAAHVTGSPGTPHPGGMRHEFGPSEWGAAGGTAPAGPRVPAARSHDRRGGPGAAGQGQDGGQGQDAPQPPAGDGPSVVPGQGGAPAMESTRAGTPARGTPVPRGLRKRGGFTAWARRLAGSRPDGEDERYGEYGAYGGFGDQGGYGDGAPDAPAGDEAYGDPAAYGADGAYDGEYEAGEAPGSPADGRAGHRPQSVRSRTWAAARTPESWPDPATLLLTALGPGSRLWERGPDHPEALTVRLGTVDRPTPDGTRLLPAVPVTVGLREAGALGLAGPRQRLTGLVRAVLAQLTALHSPETLDLVLISTDRTRSTQERVAEWAWLGWLPHLRPLRGQDCRLLLAYDRDQAAARAGELVRGLRDRLTGTGQPDGGQDAPAKPGSFTVVVVDGDPGSAALRETVATLAAQGPAAGVHVLCLADTPAASSTSPLADTYEAACQVSPVFRACGAVALLTGDVATALRLLRTADGRLAGHGTVAAVDAVSPAWAERFARALAPLRPEGHGDGGQARVSAPLPQSARLLDELGLARATPASLLARWADAADDREASGGRARAVLGAGPRGPVGVDLAAEGPHLLVEGPAGSGRTELLRAVASSLAAADRPDRLGLVLVDGRDGTGAGGTAGGSGPLGGTLGGGTLGGGIRTGAGEGLHVCTDLPHVTTHLAANDPVRMREFAQSLAAELKRRAELLGRLGFAEWHALARAHQEAAPGTQARLVAQRGAEGGPQSAGQGGGRVPGGAASQAVGRSAEPLGEQVREQVQDPGGDLEAPSSSTLRLRPGAALRQADAPPPLPRLVVLVDDLDALVEPPLGSPGRPAAGSVIRALEAVARDGARLGVHLVATAGPGGRTAETEFARLATLRAVLDAPSGGADDPAPGRGRLSGPDGGSTAFQAGRVTGRIPRTATLRPTVVPLEWERMGDPPARRSVRELGNGPTDLALLGSAVERAARSVAAAAPPPLL